MSITKNKLLLSLSAKTVKANTLEAEIASAVLSTSVTDDVQDYIIVYRNIVGMNTKHCIVLYGLES